MNPGWKSKFDERELKEIEFCRLYARDFAHGALGHNVMLIVAQMARMLDNYESEILGLKDAGHNAKQE